MSDRTCIVDGCDGAAGRPGTARGMCGRHYNRWQRWGDPLYVPPFRNKGQTCSVDGCDRAAKACGMCGTHESRMRRHGTLDDVRAFANAPDGTKWCPQCKRYKAYDDFSPSKYNADGLDAWCRRCHADRQAKWRRANPEKVKQLNREWHQRHYAANPDYYADAARRRRATKRGVKAESFSAREIAERDGWRCHICGQRIGRTIKWPDPRSLSIDHIVPLSVGGAHTRSNVQASHLRCNQQKFVNGPGQLRLLG